MVERRYPVGIQTFSRLREDGYVYVDKTDLVWKLAHYATYIFLSRPRRFGKSLLSTTLESYFLGEKEYFEGLKIMNLEKEWKKYPVIHLDLSTAKNQENLDLVRNAINLQMKPYEKQYGADPDEKTPGGKLTGLIHRAFEQTGNQVAVIIDEYDAPLLDVLHKQEELDGVRKVLQELYQPLKANEKYIKFCFITGITKFSQLSIFSTINNLTNITMLPEFSAICGITEEELSTTMREDVAMLAESYETTPEDMHSQLKLRYDGYHFSEDSPEVYNPFSLMKCLLTKKIGNYWFDSGTPTYLIRQMRRFGTDITSLDRLEVDSSAFDQPTENMKDALPLLYQSGYLTIKDYDRIGDIYTLSIPNQEVRIGYAYGLLPAYSGLEGWGVRSGFALKFWRALRANDPDLAMREMQAYLAGVPYIEGFKQKLAEAARAEGFYEYTMYLIFSMLNVYVKTQVKTSHGRADVVVLMPDAIYVLELKVNGTAEEALEQIETGGYAAPYLTDGRKIVRIGAHFTPETMTVSDWIIK